MDTLLTEPPGFLADVKFNHGSISIPPKKDLSNGFKRDGGGPSRPANGPSPASSTSSEVESPEDSDSSTSDSILKFISEILMEEDDLDGKPCMLQDCLALQAAEKSFYDILNPEYAPPSNFHYSFLGQTAGNPSLEAPHDVSSYSSNTCGCSINEHVRALDSGSLVAPCDHPTDSPISVFNLHQSSCCSTDANKDNIFIHRSLNSGSANGDVSGGSWNSVSVGVSKGKKSHGREEGDFPQEGRSNKQSAVSIDEPEEHLDLYDEVLLCQPGRQDRVCYLYDDCAEEPDIKFAQTGPSKGSNGRSGGRRKKNSPKGEVVDLWTLLTQCAQAVATNDYRGSMEVIKQIRQHSTPYGEGNQRLAHYFANGLEARLAGTEAPCYHAAAFQITSSAADILKAYQFYVQACPFKRMSNFFANRTIMKKAEKAKTIHIIDFGILYGFQWPCLIQRMSMRHSTPPKIRMTGIELPQPGFRPAERVEETCRRLEKYCKRFGVEFEYHPIAKKWETIQLNDLKLDKDDFTVVNCLYRLRNLPDESVCMNSPRDTVLKLIRKIEPDLFVHGVVNGTYNAPFFLTRFREALFHFSSLFDMFDVGQYDKENEQRMMFEREVFARDAMNVIACEGVARVERPETYKQWQVRNMRAGFRQIPMYEDILRKVKNVVRLEYHKDFMVDQDGQWMLQGWKGRIIYALSCWVPA